MHSISDNEVEFILRDLEKKGIATEDVRYNLLDHICCIIEQDMPENESFQTFYENTLVRFFKNDLKEIEEETQNLLTFKNYYAMKTTVKISGIGSALIILIGAIFKVLHLPGTAAFVLLGSAIFSLVFLPTMIALKFKDEEKTSDKWVLSFGFLIALITSGGIAFKIMHWPGANIMMTGGISTFIFLYVPIYFISRYRRVELRFNTVVNSALMMVCGGLLFGLMNLGHSTRLTENILSVYNLIEENHEYILENNRENIFKNPSIISKESNELYGDLELIKEKFLKDFNPKSQQHVTNIKSYMVYNKLNFEALQDKVKQYNNKIKESKRIDVTILKKDLPYYVCLYQVSELQTKLINNLQNN